MHSNIFSKPAVQLHGDSSVEIQIGSSLGVENANRLATIDDTYASRIKTSQAHLDALLEKKTECEAFIQKPFEKEEEFKSVMKRYNEVTARIKEGNRSEEEAKAEQKRRIDIIKDVDRFEPDDDTGRTPQGKSSWRLRTVSTSKRGTSTTSTSKLASSKRYTTPVSSSTRR